MVPSYARYGVIPAPRGCPRCPAWLKSARIWTPSDAISSTTLVVRQTDAKLPLNFESGRLPEFGVQVQLYVVDAHTVESPPRPASMPCFDSAQLRCLIEYSALAEFCLNHECSAGDFTLFRRVAVAARAVVHPFEMPLRFRSRACWNASRFDTVAVCSIADRDLCPLIGDRGSAARN
jgi:hypothetical protein